MSKVHEVSYVEERLAEIRAAMGTIGQTKPPKRTKAEAIRSRLKNHRKLAAAQSNAVLERKTTARIERFVELARKIASVR
ncbi:hypothetical protein OIU34_22230 [Pararhizobium sp. BT-229]|uniref:hypothetical protein n=1 Tax=Pararhizobium sp. BT-229 TaxID=2986923 RepID=UPI0021F75E35|nr:hypothetical protein [Pararhizobium sp. BT-229]MCV9964612.1 hypothetical protein [Pararhizobium sp. BT-229]